MSVLDKWSKADHFPSLNLGQRVLYFYSPDPAGEPPIGELLLKICVEQYGASAVHFIQTAMTAAKSTDTDINLQVQQFFQLAEKYNLTNYISVTREMIAKSAVKELTEINALTRVLQYVCQHFNIEEKIQSFEDPHFYEKDTSQTTVVLFTAVDQDTYVDKQAQLIIDNHPLGVNGFIQDNPTHPKAIEMLTWDEDNKAIYFINNRSTLDITTSRRVVNLAENPPKWMFHPFLNLTKDELQELATLEGLV